MQSAHRHSIRQFMQQQRRVLSLSQQQQHARALRQHFCLNRHLQRAQHIALYLSQAGELDLSPLIRYLWRQQRQCYLPCLAKLPKRQMRFVAYHHNSRLTPNRFGILEPLNQRKSAKIQQLDVILMPLVAFDSYGNRLGMGGGYYDYTLRRYKNRFNRQAPKLIGVAHSFQQVAQLPSYWWDVPLNAVITEQKIINRMTHGH